MMWAWLSAQIRTSALVGRSAGLGRRHACTSSFRSGCSSSGAPAQSTRALHTAPVSPHVCRRHRPRWHRSGDLTGPRNVSQARKS